MTKIDPRLTAKEPASIFSKKIEVDYKALLKSLTKGITHAAVGNWPEIANDAVEALASLGLATQPEELAFLLVKRSMIKATFDLIGETGCRQLLDIDALPEVASEKLDAVIAREEIDLDRSFLDRPAELPLIKHLQAVLKIWLEESGVHSPTAAAIVNRLPSYFVYALNQEWRRNAKSYAPLLEALNTPFAKASERERAWTLYSSILQRLIRESIFDEPFSLSQIYISLNAYYFEEKAEAFRAEISRMGQKGRRVVVPLQQELEQWLEKGDRVDTIRVISGGPGSGKSSFAHIFAAGVIRKGTPKVLYIPLHLIDATKDLVEEIGRFIRDEGILTQNPLDPESPEPNLLLIFDDLDGLASQGKIATETARTFIREVDRMVETRNLQSTKLRVLISGRELIVQENETEFRHERQILNLLPYHIPDNQREEYYDPDKLLEEDLRQEWWKKYGALTDKGYKELPDELKRADLDEITSQPLLNHLVAFSFAQGELDFTKGINVNSVYADLVAKMYARAKNYPDDPTRQMQPGEFICVLEEVGLAAWHGDGISATIGEIEERCRFGGLGDLLDNFREGTEAGGTRLLAAFFFRQYGQRPSGEQTFGFTHKSFSEYLAARRIVRAAEKIVRELEKQSMNPEEGLDERDALKYWAQICGPSTMSHYIHTFLLNEIALRPMDDVIKWQWTLAKLFSYMLRQGIPMEQFQLPFKKAMFHSRNAEEALLVVLNACARITHQVSQIEHTDLTAFGEWIRRVQGQRVSGEPPLVLACLSYLNLEGIMIHMADFFGANLLGANLKSTHADSAVFRHADLREANLAGAILAKAILEGAKLGKADLQGGFLAGANLFMADLEEASLADACLVEADLGRANLPKAILSGTDLERANLKNANLEAADLKGSNLEKANLEGANLEKAILARARLRKEQLKGIIGKPNLEEAIFIDEVERKKVKPRAGAAGKKDGSPGEKGTSSRNESSEGKRDRDKKTKGT